MTPGQALHAVLAQTDGRRSRVLTVPSSKNHMCQAIQVSAHAHCHPQSWPPLP